MHHDEYFNYTDNDAQTAIYDYTEAGHLKLFYEKDDQFTAILRKIVPAGFISWSKKPFCWVIDVDYAEDALKAARQYFEYIDHGTIE